jgi:WhiB family redox-sensing transcriptional regulator
MSLAAMQPEPDAREPHHNAAFTFLDQPWADQALCAQTDPESFFPEKGGSTRQAKAVCAQCFVQAECLDWAMTNDERFGVWGGLSERERRKLHNPIEGRTVS